MKKLLSVTLALVLALCLLTVAQAKTTSDPIDAPAADTVVFTLKAGETTLEYTWADVNGAGRFTAQTLDYFDKVNGEQKTVARTGILLADILTDAEASGVVLADDCVISAVAADGYEVTFALADVKNPENHFMVAPDAVSNYDGDTKYGESYVRIVRDADAANGANFRCITGITILPADAAK